MNEQTRSIEKIGAEMFAFRASTDLAAATLIGAVPDHIEAPLIAHSEAATAKASGWIYRLEAIDSRALPRSAELTKRYLRFEARKLADAGRLHWFDLQLTPYRLGHTVAQIHAHLGSVTFEAAQATERYLAVAACYRDYLVSTLQNLREQVTRGIVAPASALPGCLGLVKGLAASIAQRVRVPADRVQCLPPGVRAAFLARLDAMLDELRVAIGNLQAYIAGEYTRKAREGVGLSQYAGGDSAYELLIRHHTTLDLGAEEVHRLGIELVREIEDDMARVRSELGSQSTGSDFITQIRNDRRWYCRTPEQLHALYLRLMHRGAAALPKAFGARAFPPFDVKRLPPESEAGMTYGYYQPPVIGREETGYYVYNGSGLDQRSTIGAASLIYHELVPGHHLHIASQISDVGLPLVRRFPTITAFNEGWAEYAADLGFELGLYEDPLDRYGRYLLQVFLASRLVVDTGLNALGWSLQRARDYLHEHTAQSAAEIESEILRYASGLPAQALAYAPGRKHFWQIRRAAEHRLGPEFTLPAFHDAILDGGALPLADVAFSIDQWAERVAVHPR